MIDKDFKLISIIGKKNCSKCHGDGYIKKIGICEYDEYEYTTYCDCKKEITNATEDKK